MSFAEPLFLYLVPTILVLLGLLFWASESVREKRLRRFAAVKMIDNLTASASRPRRIFKMTTIALAACLLAIAAARPQYGFTLEESEGRGLDIMFALDASRSMLAEDVAPDRLDRSKLAILDLVNDLRGDEVGLIAFAGEAFLQCPLTLDYDAFRQTLDVIDTHIIARGGTDLGAAINEAREAFEGSDADKLLVLITDGEDLELRGLTAAREAAEEGIRVFTVGVGDAEGGLIPITDAEGNRDYVRDANGQPVRSALDENALRAIAAATEGIYVPLGASGNGLRQIYDQLHELFPEADQGTRIQQIPLERFQWPLGAAILLLLLEPLVAARRRLPAGAAMLALFLGASLFTPPSAEAASSVQKAQNLYDGGEFEAAAKLYEKEIAKTPDDARLHYNYGATLYRLGRWEEAKEQFSAALKTDDPDLQADAFYNRGNTEYQVGRETEDSVDGYRTRRAAWESALEDYANALSLDPGAPEVKRNSDLLSTRLAAFLLRVQTTPVPAEGGEAEPTDGFFVPGETVSLNATANEGWMFRRWESNNVELESPENAKASFDITANTNLTAVFVKTWELEVLTEDATHGTAEKSGTYPEDEPTSIKAEAKPHFAFKEWQAQGTEVADPKAAETTVQLTQNAVVTATFQDAFELKVQWQPAIGGKAGQSGWFPVYQDTPIQAEPREGFAWSGWLGDNIADPTAQQTTVTLNGDRTVTAVFDRLWNLIVVPQQEEQGTTTGSCNEPIGATVPITAEPSEGYTFDHWEGPGVTDPAAAETTVTIQSAEHDVIAIFKSDDSDQNQDQDQNQNQDQQDDSQQNQDQKNQSDSSQNQNEDQSSEDQQQDSSQSEDQENQSEEERKDQQSEEQQSDEEQAQPQEGEEQSPEEQNGEEGDQEQATPTEADQAQRVPGQMTEEEARQLLNILRESEKKLPANRDDRNKSDNTSGRDW